MKGIRPSTCRASRCSLNTSSRASASSSSRLPSYYQNRISGQNNDYRQHQQHNHNNDFKWLSFVARVDRMSRLSSSLLQQRTKSPSSIVQNKAPLSSKFSTLQAILRNASSSSSPRFPPRATQLLWQRQSYATMKGRIIPSLQEVHDQISKNLEDNNYDGAESLLNDAIKLKPNDISFHIMIEHYLKKDDVNKALTYIQKMREANIVPIYHRLNYYVQQLSIRNKIQEAVQLLQDYQESLGSEAFQTAAQGVDPFIHVLLALTKANRMTDAEIWIQQMQQMGVPPRELYLCTMAKGYFDVGNTSKAVSIMHEMRRGLQPSIVSYNVLIEGLCRQNLSHEAFKIYQLMKKDNIRPDKFTINAFMSSAMRSGSTRHALQWWRAHKALKIPADTVSYTTMIDGYMKNREPQEALTYFFDMQQGGLSTQPNIITYNALLSGFFRNRLQNDAIVTAKHMQANHIQPDHITDAILGKNALTWELCLNNSIKTGKYCAYNSEKKQMEMKADDTFGASVQEGWSLPALHSNQQQHQKREPTWPLPDL